MFKLIAKKEIFKLSSLLISVLISGTSCESIKKKSVQSEPAPASRSLASTSKRSLSRASVPAKNFEEAKQAVWLIGTGETWGTAFFVSPNLVVTNFHVVNSFINKGSLLKTYLIQKPYKQIEIEEILAVSLFSDLALLKTKSSAPFYLNLKEPPLHSKKELFIVGYPAGNFRIKRSRGPIQKTKFNLFFLTSRRGSVHDRLLLGGSGSPVLDSDGKVWGVYYQVIKPNGLKISASVFALNSFLEKNKHYPCKEQGLSQCINTAFQELYKKAEQENNPIAQDRLSKIYARGMYGVEKNKQKWLFWSNKAYKQDYMLTLYEAGLEYYYGNKKTKRDRKSAIYFLQKSADQGFTPAQSLLDELTFSPQIQIPQTPPTQMPPMPKIPIPPNW